MGVLRIGQRALCYGLGREPSRFCQLSGAAFCSSLTILVRAGSNAGRDLRDALDALPGLDSLRRGREAARRRIGRHGSTHDGP